MEFTVQNWEDVYQDSYMLFEQIRQDNYFPNIVVGIARGGWIPARLIADFFHLKQTANIKVEAYQMLGQEEIDPVITQKIQTNLAGKNVLIIDDVVDSGATLETVLDNIKGHQPSSIRSAVLYYKPHAEFDPDYFVNKTSDWVVFSWSYFETMEDLRQKWSKEGLDTMDIVKRCKEIGIPPQIVNTFFQQLEM